MDPLSTVVPGSRHPITLLGSERPKSPTHPSKTNGDDAVISSRMCETTSRIHRKPVHTYKSPAAHELLSLRIEGHVGRCRSGSHHASDHTVSEPINSTSNVVECYHLSPPLPLYHPLGHLALSAPILDPTLYGHSNTVNVEEYAQIDADAIRRSSSRARRPAAKLRDRDMADDEMSAVLDGASVVNGQVGNSGSSSPRKRRTGGGLSSRRRRRENGTDGAYPNPPKRTRNTRGAAAFASPLAGPSITTADDDRPNGGNDAERSEADRVSAALDTQDTQVPAQAAGDLEVQEQRRSTRSRRARPSAPTRRHSSASETTTTSVSVSIAANARGTRSSGAKVIQEASGQEDSQVDADMKQEGVVGERVNETNHGEVQNSSNIEAKSPQPASGDKEAEAVVEKGSEDRGAAMKVDETSKVDGPSQAELPMQSGPSERHEQTEETATRGEGELVNDEGKDEGGKVDRENMVPQEPQTPEKLNPREPPIPEKPTPGQKIAPSSWTRFATPVAGPIGPSANQKKSRDEEKEEGELSEESDSPPPRKR